MGLGLGVLQTTLSLLLDKHYHLPAQVTLKSVQELQLAGTLLILCLLVLVWACDWQPVRSDRHHTWLAYQLKLDVK